MILKHKKPIIFCALVFLLFVSAQIHRFGQSIPPNLNNPVIKGGICSNFNFASFIRTICEHTPCHGTLLHAEDDIFMRKGDKSSFWNLPSFTKCKNKPQTDKIAEERFEQLKELSKVSISSGSAHNVLLVGDSVMIQMGQQSVLCALLSGLSDELLEGLEYTLFSGDLKLTYDVENGGDIEDQRISSHFFTKKVPETNSNLALISPTLLLNHPQFDREITITQIYGYSFSPFNELTVEAEAVRNTLSISLSTVGGLQNAFDTVLYNAGHHHNFNNVHGSGIMGSAERIADVKEEYSNLLARLIEVGGSHNQGRAFMVETVGQNFPNDSGIYLGKKSEVVGEGGCSGPWDEGRWQEEGNWRNVILKERINEAQGEVVLIELADYFIQKGELKRANLLIETKLDCTHFIDFVAEASYLFSQLT